MAVNVIENVRMDDDVISKWTSDVSVMIAELCKKGLLSEDEIIEGIPMDSASPQADGTLLLELEIRGMRTLRIVPKGKWTYKNYI